MSLKTAFLISYLRAYKREYTIRSRTPDIEIGARGIIISYEGISSYRIRVIVSSSYLRKVGNSYTKEYIAYLKN